MTKYHVYILTDQNIAHTSYIYGNKSLYVSVSEKVPYDKYSKRFKLFTHTIEYTEKYYKYEDYFVEIYDPNRHFYKYLIKYNKPLHKVIAVDLFFSMADKYNNIPLVIGFHQENEATSYYTANFLYYFTSGLFAHQVKNHFLPRGAFPENDLLTRLLEELSLYLKDDRKDKLVLKSDLRPTTKSITYPLSGPNEKKMTVSKIFEQKIHYFDKYTHVINKASEESGFYISYKTDSLYIELNDSKYKKLTYFNTYYNSFDYSTPIVFVLKFHKGTKLYKYDDFAKNLRDSKLTINVTDLKDFDDSKIHDELTKENNRVSNYVTYLIDKKTEYSYQIYVRENELFKNKYGFKNYTHRPYINYNDKKSHLVFNGKKMLKWKTIARLVELYDERSVTFESVDVYFGTRKPDYPLIVKVTKTGQHKYNPDFFVHKRSYSDEFWEQLYVRSGEITENILLSKLNKTDFDLIPSVVLLLDKKENYSYRDIVLAVGRSETPKDFILSQVETKGIKAEDKTGTLGACINGKGFKMVEQNLNVSVKHNGERGLRFYTLSSMSGRYSEITLHSSDQEPFDAYEEYIYYDPNHTSVYVYFYSNNNMPLMICYGNSAYKPHSNVYYSEKWVKVHDLNTFVCSSSSEKGSENDLLLSTLTEIATSLGLIIVEEAPKATHTITPEIEVSRTETTKEVPKFPSVDTDRSIPARIPEVPKITSVDINLSITDTTSYGTLFNISVSSKTPYPDLNLFCYYTHTSNDEKGFNISSFSTNYTNKKITFERSMENVTSVTVYFNTYNTANPIMIGITTSDNVTNYYVNVIQNAQSYSFSSLQLASKENLTQILMEESDKINKSLTYHLEKTLKPGERSTYGYDDGIKITKNVKTSSRVTVFTHEPNKGQSQSAKSFVLFNQKLVDTKTSDRKADSLNIQDKTYKNINVYSLNNDVEFPLIIELNEDKNISTYLCRMDGYGKYWQKKTLNISDNKIELELFEVSYPLKNSVIIQIDKKNPNKKDKFNYPMKIISNKGVSHGKYVKNKFLDAEPFLSQTIKVSDPNYPLDRDVKGQGLFYYVSHQLEEQPSELIDKKNVAGVRFFMTNIGTTQPEEIYFYENVTNVNDSKGPLSFYYPPQSGSNKIYVFFYDDDPRPLFVIYDGHTYKRINLENDTQWVRVGKANYSDFSDQLKILKDIYKTIKKKITLLKDGEKDANIRVKKDKLSGNFLKYSYSVEFNYKKEDASLKLPIKELVKGNLGGTSLDKLLENLYSQSFDSINVFKTSDGSSLKNILVFEFVSGNEKIHISRKDEDGKYWIRHTISGNIDNNFLSKIQSEISTSLIYDIGKKVSYEHKIKFESFLNDPVEGFTKYTHSPKDGVAKKSVILYNGNDLLEKSRNEYKPISSLNNKIYDKVIVYFGSRTNKEMKDFPLLIELNITKSGDNIFYKHKREDKKHYWEHTQVYSHGKDRREFIGQLKLIELDLIGSVIIFMDKRSDRYGENDAKEVLKQTSPKLDFNIHPSDSKCISVANVTSQSQGSCFKDSGFLVFEHEMLSCVKENDTSGIRFLISIDKSINKYREINLYNSSNYIDTLYYSKPGGNNKVYVYYYGGLSYVNIPGFDNSDPRPLLIFYGNRAYKPSKPKDPYRTKHINVDYTIWVQVDGLSNPFCDSYNNHQKSDLLETLVEVYGYLNPIQINPRMIPEVSRSITGPLAIDENYVLDSFGSTSIQISIRSDNLKCYRKYTYDPYYITNAGSFYRLGHLIYTDNFGKTYTINYSNSQYKYYPLLSASVFYNVFDYNHNYPLLLVLIFVRASSSSNEDNIFVECYKLTSKDGDPYKNWERVDEYGEDKKFLNDLRSLYHELESLDEFANKFEHLGLLDDSKEFYFESEKLSDEFDNLIEGKLYSIRTNLSIEFSEEEKKNPLFDPKHCSEGSNKAAVIGGSVGGVVGTAAVGGGVTLAVRPELVVPVINALT